jgi:hypothetical protein
MSAIFVYNEPVLTAALQQQPLIACSAYTVSARYPSCLNYVHVRELLVSVLATLLQTSLLTLKAL